MLGRQVLSVIDREADRRSHLGGGYDVAGINRLRVPRRAAKRGLGRRKCTAQVQTPMMAFGCDRRYVELLFGQWTGSPWTPIHRRQSGLFEPSHRAPFLECFDQLESAWTSRRMSRA